MLLNADQGDEEGWALSRDIGEATERLPSRLAESRMGERSVRRQLAAVMSILGNQGMCLAHLHSRRNFGNDAI